MSNLPIDYKLVLEKQCETLNFQINEQADKLKTLPVNTFTLNPDIEPILNEIRRLTAQRDVVIKEINSMED